ncbi:LOG family protein [Kocuria tytonis]|uniref:TIGR00730 family Rossman fold protein n=1 Tax=Kocuria tytonis TaxID=2054280 RepID=A0A495A9U4_9MICC|nr:TIGR00730 family Rossman fold protein [Kocuria tytonis]RKQ36768.1 TIGR00730 family Rossman fold protein [Kocuria tytonis]
MQNNENAPEPTVPAERHKGPVVLRRRQLERRTSDQRFLDQRPAEPDDFTRTDPWRVLRIQAEFVEGFDALANLGPAITVFGSARTAPGHPEYELGRELGRAIGQAGYAVVTGGGPGVMEAANRGAVDVGAHSVGIGIELPHEQHLNHWVDLGINFRYFFARKTMFVKYSQGFVALPGGFGTLDELFEALTLVQTGKITRFPVILVGTEYWGPLRDWITGTLVAGGKVAEADLDLLRVVDTAAEVVEILASVHAEDPGMQAPARVDAAVPGPGSPRAGAPGAQDGQAAAPDAHEIPGEPTPGSEA